MRGQRSHMRLVLKSHQGVGSRCLFGAPRLLVYPHITAVQQCTHVHDFSVLGEKSAPSPGILSVNTGRPGGTTVDFVGTGIVTLKKRLRRERDPRHSVNLGLGPCLRGRQLAPWTFTMN